MAYIPAEIAANVVGFVWLIVCAIVQRVFFLVIDVIPARGRDDEEAIAIVKGGPFVWLSLKMQREIENWTYRDTAAFVAALPWRTRLVNSHERVEDRLALMREYYERTGRQINTLNSDEIKKMIAHLEPTWLARMFANPFVFWAVIRFAIVFACVMIMAPTP